MSLIDRQATAAADLSFSPSSSALVTRGIQRLKMSTAAVDGGHTFGKKTFHKPTYCHHCSDLLWGLIGQGYICEGEYLICALLFRWDLSFSHCSPIIMDSLIPWSADATNSFSFQLTGNSVFVSARHFIISIHLHMKKLIAIHSKSLF